MATSKLEPLSTTAGQSSCPAAMQQNGRSEHATAAAIKPRSSSSYCSASATPLEAASELSKGANEAGFPAGTTRIPEGSYSWSNIFPSICQRPFETAAVANHLVELLIMMTDGLSLCLVSSYCCRGYDHVERFSSSPLYDSDVNSSSLCPFTFSMLRELSSRAFLRPMAKCTSCSSPTDLSFGEPTL